MEDKRSPDGAPEVGEHERGSVVRQLSPPRRGGGGSRPLLKSQLQRNLRVNVGKERQRRALA